jgi:hypothetical protein
MIHGQPQFTFPRLNDRHRAGVLPDYELIFDWGFPDARHQDFLSNFFQLVTGLRMV